MFTSYFLTICQTFIVLSKPQDIIFEPSIFITMAVTDDLFVGSVYFKDFYHIL